MGLFLLANDLKLVAVCLIEAIIARLRVFSSNLKWYTCSMLL